MAGDTIHPVVRVAIQDSFGDTVAAATNVVTLALGTSPGGGTLTGTVSAAPTNGVATFSNLHIDKPGAGYTLTATSPGLTRATSAAFDITPAATQLVFAVQPEDGTAGANIAPAVQVAVTDSSGNTATLFAGSVTVAIGTNPAGGALAGTTTVNAVNGVATFGSLSIRRAGTGYTLAAASGTLKGATSAAFAVAPAAPGALSFVAQPGNATAGAAISPAVAVAVRDTFGNTLPSAAFAVSVAIGANPGGGTLSGTTTANAVNGVATFSDLSIQKASGGYTLTAASGALKSATSATFAIAPAASAQLGFVVPPSIVDLSRPISPAVQVAIQDAFGNTVPTASGAVTIALGANPGGATLSGTFTAGAVNGVAAFADLALDKLGSGYTLGATSGTLTAATSPPFSVTQQQLVAFVMEDQNGNHRGIGAMRDDGSGVVQLTASGDAPAWSADGMKIAFLDNSGVAVMNANGTGIVSSLMSLAPAASGILWNLAWSPDGTKVAFLGDSGVFVMNVDGTGVANILQRSAGPYGTFVNGLAWKPDGSGLVFSGGYDYSTGLFLMAPDGSGVTRILPGQGLYLNPTSWSPDGSRLVMSCGSYVCVANANGTGFAQLASGALPSWKPDGTRILFTGTSGLSLMNPDGSGVTPLVSTNAAPGYPVWSPDGLRVAMVTLGACSAWSYSWYSSTCLSFTPDAVVVVNADGSAHVVNPAGTEPAWRP
jgi:Tol biopolymer transport system component